jgi:hypothetical protein
MRALVFGGSSIVAIGMIIAGLLAGGRYPVAPSNQGIGVFIVDRLSGSARICYGGQLPRCQPIPENSN